MWLKLKHIHPCASHGVLTPWIFLKASISPQDFITASSDAVIACVGQQAPSLICISQGLSSVQAARVCIELSTRGWLHSVVAVLIQVIINNNVRLEVNLLCLVHDWCFSLVRGRSPSWEGLLHPILGLTLHHPFWPCLNSVLTQGIGIVQIISPLLSFWGWSLISKTLHGFVHSNLSDLHPLEWPSASFLHSSVTLALPGSTSSWTVSIEAEHSCLTAFSQAVSGCWNIVFYMNWKNQDEYLMLFIFYN